MNNTAAKIFTARSQRFSSKQLHIGALGKDLKRYIIPAYQRPYAWTSDQVSQLMHDLLDFYQKADSHSTYSLGTIVCDEESPGIFSILDGQQRLTTIDILLGEIRRRLGQISDDKRQRIISAYMYLRGCETSNESPLPACREQRNCIARSLTEYIEQRRLRDVQETLKFLKEFETCIQNRVNIQRVVIPLSDKVENEAPAMFEIINMRGQTLSALDILKSNLLSRFSENDRLGRTFFTHLWRTTEERLASPDKAAEGYDLKGWQSDENPHVAMPTSEYLTIEEIITNADLAAEFAHQQKQNDEQPDNETDSDSKQLYPPIDMMNMLVIANELLKSKKDRSVTTESNTTLAYQALATTEFSKRFDHIVRADTVGTTDVWRLMGALSIVLQTVGSWGRYRDKSSDQFDGNPDTFNQLIQTFMAASGFSLPSQYWLLVLSATALENCLGKDGELPTDPKAFCNMKKPEFETIRKIAELRLLAWGYHVAELGQDSATEAVFKLIEETPTENAAQSKLSKSQAAVEYVAQKWRYDDGSISQFDLFLTDYVLWVDGHSSDNSRFSSLKRAMTNFANKVQTKEQTDIARAFENFDWTTYEEKAENLHIVARSDIEHWLARNRADLEKDTYSTEEELLRRQGFGNLALINESDNSTLGNGTPAGKAELVLKRMSNPTPKLLWLAVLSQKFTNLSGRHVEDLTKFWASYIGNFSFL